MAHRGSEAGSGVARWELALYGALLAYFVGRVVFLAVRIHPLVPPDEMTHVGRVLAYAGTWGIPENGPSTFEYGLVDHRPWLYYWVMARALSLNVFGLIDLVYLRLVNGALAVATVVIGIQWMRTWCGNPVVRVLFAVLVTNMLMFTGLAGAVSYDNGANLAAAGALLALSRFRVDPRPTTLWAFFALVLAGCLTKRTLLPLGFLLVGVLVFREHARLRAFLSPSRALRWLRARPIAHGALAAAVALLLAAVVALYGGNLLRFGSLRPAFDQVVSERDAMQNRVYARSRILDRFRAGELSYPEAVRLAGEIRHMGDRSDTLVLLKTAQLPDSRLIGPVAYARAWADGMLATSVGYLGHRRVEKSDAALLGYQGIFLAAGALMLLSVRRWSREGAPVDALFLVLGYALVLMWLVNYPNYLQSRYVELALQGRYLFPVLVPIQGLVAYHLIAPLPVRIAPWVAALAAGVYLQGDFPWFLPQLDERWFFPPLA